MQKGKILNWIIFLVVIVILLGLLLYYQSSKKPPAGTITTQTVEETTKVTKPRKEFAVAEMTQSEKDTSDNDAYNRALLSGSGCENIKFNDKLKQLCLDTLAYNDARSKNDEKICEQISDIALKTKCFDQIYLDIAVKSSDKSLCEKITEANIKQTCLDQLLAFSGGSLKSAADCTVIKDMALKQVCLDNFYFGSSVSGLDSNGCKNISDPGLQDRCLNTITKSVEIKEAAKVQSANTYQTPAQKLTGCNNLQGDAASSCKNEANFNLAAEKKDISYCDKITDNTFKTNCVQTQSVTINNYYLKQAVRLKDSSLCGKILDSGLRATCLSSM